MLNMKAINKMSPTYTSVPLSHSTTHNVLFTSLGSMANSPVIPSVPALGRLSFAGSTERLPAFYPKSPPEEVKERIVVLVEHNGNRYNKERINFDSPRTSEAAAQLGITYEDCLKRYSA